jgi:hypothetical protein
MAHELEQDECQCSDQKDEECQSALAAQVQSLLGVLLHFLCRKRAQILNLEDLSS